MKKNFKKALAILLTLCTVLTLLTACGGGSTAGDAAGGDASDGGGSSVPSGEVITWRLQSNYALDSLEGEMAKNLKESVHVPPMAVCRSSCTSRVLCARHLISSPIYPRVLSIAP